MPRSVSARRAPRRRSSPHPSLRSTTQELCLSSAEKHELIRAHTARRAPQDLEQRFSLWAGVAAAFLLIVLGWWWAAKPNYASLIARPADPTMQEIKQQAGLFGEKTRAELEEAAKRLSTLEAELRQQKTISQEQEHTLEMMATLIHEQATRSLFAPQHVK